MIPQINRRRSMRALEIAHFGQDLANEETDYEPYLICLDDDRSLIYDRINRRVDRMLEEGLLNEARWLLMTIRRFRQLKALVTRNSFLTLRRAEP